MMAIIETARFLRERSKLNIKRPLTALRLISST